MSLYAFELGVSPPTWQDLMMNLTLDNVLPNDS